MRHQKRIASCIKAITLSSVAIGATVQANPVTLGNAFTSTSASNSHPSYPASNAIDGSKAGSSCWQTNSPASLTLDTGGPSMMQGIYLWMHKSNLRTSDIKVTTTSAYAEGSTQIVMENVHISMTPANPPTRIEFDTPVLAQEIMLQFTANSISQYNSIGEVSWE